MIENEVIKEDIVKNVAKINWHSTSNEQKIKLGMKLMVLEKSSMFLQGSDSYARGVFNMLIVTAICAVMMLVLGASLRTVLLGSLSIQTFIAAISALSALGAKSLEHDAAKEVNDYIDTLPKLDASDHKEQT